jgi:hypothetical protein
MSKHFDNIIYERLRVANPLTRPIWSRPFSTNTFFKKRLLRRIYGEERRGEGRVSAGRKILDTYNFETF